MQLKPDIAEVTMEDNHEFWEWVKRCPPYISYAITDDDDNTVEITFWSDKEATNATEA